MGSATWALAGAAVVVVLILLLAARAGRAGEGKKDGYVMGMPVTCWGVEHGSREWDWCHRQMRCAEHGPVKRGGQWCAGAPPPGLIR